VIDSLGRMGEVRVAIDTSALRNDRLSSGSMEALARYAEKGYVEILVPFVAAGEFSTKSSSKIDSLLELRKCIKNLKQNLPNDLHPRLSEFESSIAEEFDNLELTAKQRFQQWQERTGAIIIEPTGDHAKNVMDRYFKGQLPFGSPKARVDIPDAFIVEAIIGAAADDELFAVTRDGRVAEALKAVPLIKVFQSVKALLESDEFEEALTDTEIVGEYEQANIERIVEEFKKRNTRFHRNLEAQVSRLVAGKTIHYRNPHYDERDGPDELYIDSVEEVSDWTFEDSDYLGEGVITVVFGAKAEVSVDDQLGGNYYDEDGTPDSSRMVTISGAVSIAVDPQDLLQNPSKETPDELLDRAAISIDEVDDISLVRRPY
jgi:hypothetical protein